MNLLRTHAPRRNRWIATSSALSLVLATFASSRADDPAPRPAAIEGIWVRHQQTPNGRVTITKVHKDQSTTLTAVDENGAVLYAHTSKYRTEQTGKVSIFTILNRTITAGPNAGQTQNTPSSFVYRVVNDRFIEVRGVLEGDNDPPALVVWERPAR